MDKALNYLAIARKAGLVELGEEPVGIAARELHARLVVVASDASDHTWRRAASFVAGTDQQRTRLPFNKDELGMAVGRQSLAIAAFTDAALALAFVQALPENEALIPVKEALTRKAEQQKARLKEQKAHRNNVRTGKVCRKAAKKD